MIGFDLSVGADLAGAPPVVVTDETTAEVFPDVALPRLQVEADVVIPGSSPKVSAVVGLVATEWNGSYATGIDYEAAVVETGIDLAFRAAPFDEPGADYTGLRVRPWGELGVGGRGVGLFHTYWDDIGRLGCVLRAGMGVDVGNGRTHVTLAAKYEGMLAGTGMKGVLDSNVSDMKWVWTPSGSRIWISVGAGFR